MNEIDRLMHEDPLNLSAQDIDEIIAYNRRLMDAYESGVKVEKDTPKIDMAKLGLAPKVTPLLRGRKL
jgi:hypothetical protein